MSIDRHHWDTLRAPEFLDGKTASDIAIVPIGSTEQHGPHLPVMVDSRLVAEVAARAASITTGNARVLVTPVLWVSMRAQKKAKRYSTPPQGRWRNDSVTIPGGAILNR